MRVGVRPPFLFLKGDPIPGGHIGAEVNSLSVGRSIRDSALCAKDEACSGHTAFSALKSNRNVEFSPLAARQVFNNCFQKHGEDLVPMPVYKSSP